MKIDNISDEMWELLFGVQRSVRYHDRRIRFFERLHSLTAGLTAFLGTGAFSVLVSESTKYRGAATYAIAAVALLGVFDLVIGYSRRAREHNSIRNRFIELEAGITRDSNDELLSEYQARRLIIETDEPPKLHALDAMCHFELLRAKDLATDQHVKKLRPWFLQRLTAHFFAWA